MQKNNVKNWNRFKLVEDPAVGMTWPSRANVADLAESLGNDIAKANTKTLEERVRSCCNTVFAQELRPLLSASLSSIHEMLTHNDFCPQAKFQTLNKDWATELTKDCQLIASFTANRPVVSITSSSSAGSGMQLGGNHFTFPSAAAIRCYESSDESDYNDE